MKSQLLLGNYYFLFLFFFSFPFPFLFFFFFFITGDIRVTLAVFSGREDPEWTIFSNDTVNYNAIQKLLGAARGGRFLHLPEQMPPRFGYKGFVVKEGKNEHLVVGTETVQLQQLLLNTITRGLLLEGDIQDVKAEIASGEVKAELAKAKFKRYVPEFQGDIHMWATERARICNNCYNYANIRRTDNFAQPGVGSGQRFAEYSKAAVLAGAERDGLVLLDPQPGANDSAPGPFLSPDPRHLVALVVRPSE